MNPDRIINMVCAWPTCTEGIRPYVEGYIHLDGTIEADHPACRDSLQATRFMAAQGLMAEVVAEHRQFTPREWRRGLELALGPK